VSEDSRWQPAESRMLKPSIAVRWFIKFNLVGIPSNCLSAGISKIMNAG